MLAVSAASSRTTFKASGAESSAGCSAAIAADGRDTTSASLEGSALGRAFGSSPDICTPSLVFARLSRVQLTYKYYRLTGCQQIRA